MRQFSCRFRVWRYRCTWQRQLKPLALEASDAVIAGYSDPNSASCGVSHWGLRTRDLYSDAGLAARIRAEEVQAINLGNSPTGRAANTCKTWPSRHSASLISFQGINSLVLGLP